MIVDVRRTRVHASQAYQRLFVAEDSPIRDFYPTKFAIDMNGKRFTWQAVVLLPFIDERRLLDAVKDAEVGEMHAALCACYALCVSIHLST